MPLTYPPTAPTYSDPNITISRFLEQPTFVARRLNTLGDLRYVGNLLLPGRQSAAGGAIGYEAIEGVFAADSPEVVNPGAEYKLTSVALGTASLAKVSKWGEDTLITDESVSRTRNISVVDRALMKLVNSAAVTIDAAVISTIASAITQTRAAAAAWSTNPASVLTDLLRARADIAQNNQGYNPDTVLVDDTTYAYLAGNTTIAAAMARETANNPVQTGRVWDRLAGMRIVNAPTANLPGGTSNAWVFDSNMLGFIATEDLQGGYQAAGDLVQSKTMREDLTDSWRVRARANFVAVVTDPGAGFKITGV